MPKLFRVAAGLVVCTACRASQVNANVSADFLQEPSVTPFRSLYVGSVTAGCSLCRDSGNCSIAMDNTSPGVFCGDLRTSTYAQPCCCPYFTECRVTSTSLYCNCGGMWPSAIRHERLSTSEPFDTDTLTRENTLPGMVDPIVDQMSISTEILIHLSVYLALFVFAMYVDQWVECFRDFRRIEMVSYSEDVNMRLLRLRQRVSKRRRISQTATEMDDDQPLLSSESSAPTSTSNFIIDTMNVEDTIHKSVGERNVVLEEVAVITVPVDAVQEVDFNSLAPL